MGQQRAVSSWERSRRHTGRCRSSQRVIRAGAAQGRVGNDATSCISLQPFPSGTATDAQVPGVQRRDCGLVFPVNLRHRQEASFSNPRATRTRIYFQGLMESEDLHGTTRGGCPAAYVQQNDSTLRLAENPAQTVCSQEWGCPIPGYFRGRKKPRTATGQKTRNCCHLAVIRTEHLGATAHAVYRPTPGTREQAYSRRHLQHKPTKITTSCSAVVRFFRSSAGASR